jgi:hypothetical protein
VQAVKACEGEEWAAKCRCQILPFFVNQQVVLNGLAAKKNNAADRCHQKPNEHSFVVVLSNGVYRDNNGYAAEQQHKGVDADQRNTQRCGFRPMNAFNKFFAFLEGRKTNKSEGEDEATKDKQFGAKENPKANLAIGVAGLL